MQRIKHLPSAVCGSLRSSVIFFDITRVVEELILNSIDAGATKVHILINIGASYIKVEDDGCGISRDGLLLLGEKHATSKLGCLAETETGIESLGIRGEALGSLSDISLVEIITKARGKPNGYRKVIKGCKCLFLGIDDHRQDVGTTVVVRDLFYNQPVRRKCMQTSPKKVLHSVKQCILCTALACPQVLFKVFDSEGEDEILCTLPSASPLLLVASTFGNEVSGSLHEVNFADGIYKMSGYLSGPADTFSTKVFQHIYINSRHVCKGPIHKLLNRLMDNRECSERPWENEAGFETGKWLKMQGYPAYMLMLCCPQSSYDLNFEPSKTVVEFKEWSGVLSFVEKAVRHFWSQFSSYSLKGKSYKHENDAGEKGLYTGDVCESSTMGYKKSKTWHSQNSAYASPSADVDVSSDFNVRNLPRESSTDAIEIRRCQSKRSYDIPDCSWRVMSSAWFGSDSKDCQRPGSSGFTTSMRDTDFFLAGDHLLLKSSLLRQNAKDDMMDNTIRPRWRYSSLDVDEELHKGLTEINAKSAYSGYKGNEGKLAVSSLCHVAEEAFFSNPLATRDVPEQYDLELLSHHRGSEIQHTDFQRGRKRPASFIATDVFHLWTPLKEKHRASLPSSDVIRKCNMNTEFDPLSCDLSKCNDSGKKCEKSIYENCLITPIRNTESSSELRNSPLGFESPCTGVTPLVDNEYGEFYATEEDFVPYKSTSFRGFKDWGTEHSYHHDNRQCSLNGEDFRTCINNQVQSCFIPKKCENRGSSNKWFTEFTDEKMDLGPLSSSTTDDHQFSVFHIPSQNYHKIDENLREEGDFENHGRFQVAKVRSRRSCSAPPFYEGRKKYTALHNCLTIKTEPEPNLQSLCGSPILPGTMTNVQIKDSSECKTVSLHSSKPLLAKDVPLCSRIDGIKMVRDIDEFEKLQSTKTEFADSIEGCISDELQHEMVTLSKWRNADPQPKDGVNLHIPHGQENEILDISSGILHLSGGLLVPETISRDCLEGAKVLHQLDRKFIPVVAGGILAIIDQHAADERIRLEELRRKVLSGVEKTITFLESEQELVLPEIGFQLLQSYSGQIQEWGWICNVDAQGSCFSKNMNLLRKRPLTVTLVAVPCILGINLSDKDLVEFLDQLAQTDGTSIMPPAVTRILNFKACRGAIMFGDSLLPSECSIIVEELKASSLCFQCAHGRPTTVPIVDMKALHKQLAKLRLQNGDSSEWHGLRRHKPNLERAELRLCCKTRCSSVLV